MKDKMSNLLDCLIFFLLGILLGLNIYHPYDANRDFKINSQDYVMIKSYIMRGCDING